MDLDISRHPIIYPYVPVIGYLSSNDKYITGYSSGQMTDLGDLCTRILQCKMCDLHFFRKKAVCGRGSSTSSIFLIGEAPGSKEDETGLPFVGRSGAMLDRILSDIGISRDELYITNAVKCRPGRGKTPRISEIKTCSVYLKSEIEAMQPRILIPMGNSAMKSLGLILGIKMDNITSSSGKFFMVKNMIIAPQFHPAAILRNPKRLEYFKDHMVRAFELARNIPAKIDEVYIKANKIQVI